MSKPAKIGLTVLILIIGGFIFVGFNIAAGTVNHPVGIIFIMGMAAGITAIWKKKPESEKKENISANNQQYDQKQ